MDDSINKSYSASPERLYLIDEDGVIRHKSVTGPFQMQAIEDWYAALKTFSAVSSIDTAKAS
jgi:hypothetical protein